MPYGRAQQEEDRGDGFVVSTGIGEFVTSGRETRQRGMRRPWVPVLIVVAALVAACGAPAPSQSVASSSPSPAPSTSPAPTGAPTAVATAVSPGDAPGVLLVTCTPSGSEVETPRVAVQRDGVHVQIRNTIGADVAFMVDGVGGDNAPDPQQNQIWLLPTGPARVWCGNTDPVSSEDWINVELVDPHAYYVADAVECASASGATIDYVENATGPRGDPIEVARQQISGLRDGDLVERAGYAGSPGARSRCSRRSCRGRRVLLCRPRRRLAHHMATICGGSGLSWDREG